MIPEDMEILEAALAEGVEVALEELERNGDFGDMYEGEELVDFEPMPEEELEVAAMYNDLVDLVEFVDYVDYVDFDDYVDFEAFQALQVFEDLDDFDLEIDLELPFFEQFLMVIRYVFQ